MSVPFRILSLLLCLLIAGPMSTPAWVLARPETRVGRSSVFSSASTSADLDQTLEPRRESRGCDYDFASGVCKYLYAHGNPVNRIDPSGNIDFNVTSFLSAKAIRTGLYGAGLGAARGAYFQFLHNGNRLGWNVLGQAALQGGIGFVGGVALANVPFAFWTTPVGAGGIALTSAASLKRAIDYAENGDWDLAFIEAATAGAPLVFRNVVARGATVESLRAANTISGKKNIAFAEYEIGGMRGDRWAVSGESPRGGSVAPVSNPQFSSARPFDTEKLILEDLVATVIKGGNPNGTIRIHTERPACEHCEGVIAEFMQMFPGIRVTVTNLPW